MALRVAVFALLATAVCANSAVFQRLQSSQFSGFAKLLEHADLLPTLKTAIQSGSHLTFLCPSDDTLLAKTSPTLLAFLKLPENKGALRKVLLSHILPEKLSPFQWDGEHNTLQGTPMKLSVDSHAFYANDMAISHFNALLLGEASVHSIPALAVPSSLSAATQAFSEDASDVRRVLAGGVANAPAPATTPPIKPEASTPNAASAQALASLVTLAGALLLSALVF